MNSTSTRDDYRELIERFLKQTLASADPKLREHHGMMEYHLGWVGETLDALDGSGGKRLRPILCLLACKAAGGDIQKALPAAAAIEILHNFSLVHDDVEDNSQTRRGRKTIWHLWGVPQAVNVGDALFSYAHLSLTKLSDKGVPDRQVVAAVRAFDETCVALTEGQYLDMAFEERLDVSISDYMSMIELKTGALMGLSSELGALLAGSSPDQTSRFRSFGRSLGVAYQIEDDILGIWGDERATGKSAASDILEKKKTLPVIYGLECGPGLGLSVAERLTTLYRRDRLTPDDVPTVVSLLDEVGARAYAQDLADQALDQARSELRATGLDPADLRELLDLAAALRRRPQ
jgi:geranylgeranyl diphosphate synthase type I